MRLYIAGGCSEHGRNSFLAEGDGVCFLVDAGIMKEKRECPYPMLTREQLAGVQELYLTHSHADHCGALPWLYEHGFRGRVIAAAPTLAALPHLPGEAVRLEELAPALTETEVRPGLSLLWGKSGHCIGSVWYRFRTKERTLLFTGDYTEHSRAYRCDRIRELEADAAVIDCAYGRDPGTADYYRKQLDLTVGELAKGESRLLFPVPKHGRGLDVIRILTERGAVCVAEDGVFSDRVFAESSADWLKDGCRKALAEMELIPLSAYLADPEGSIPQGRCAGILVCDSQLAEERNRRLADRLIEEGGSVVLTGKQDPAGYAKKLFLEGRALFSRIPVHQNTAETEMLDGRNHFGTVIPYHCRQVLDFGDEHFRVLHPGESFEF